MVRESKQVGVQLSCETLGVSTSGYYAWLERPESERKQRNNELMSQIVKISDASQSTYGRPRIQRTLLGMGIRCGKTRLENMMKLAGVSGQIKKRFRVKTTDSNHTNPISERVFKTEPWHTHPTQANQVWASDITYVHTNEGFVFLAIFLDLFTKKVVGFSTNDHMRSELIINALEMAIGRQKTKDINGRTLRPRVSIRELSQRQLLRQRLCREFFCYNKKGADLSNKIRHKNGGKKSHI